MIHFETVLLLIVSVARVSWSVEEDAHKAISQTPSPSWTPGCNQCAYYRCPGDLERCALGPVTDSCGCCPKGVCARLPGESCWNSTLQGKLAPERRNDGFCAENYQCQLRTDLHAEDEPEAICVCAEEGYACGTDNITYSTTCQLLDVSRQAKKKSLALKNKGPCPSRPEMQSARHLVLVESAGRMISVECDVKAFPLPKISWRYRSADGKTFIELPGPEHDAVINSMDGPDPMTRSSTMQLARLTKDHRGSYECIASNPSGKDALYAYLDVTD
ncbi:insulin-like growth factor-binding protein-related protein 1 isoform X2 [Athalia rosae]|uniref:insulin-like growth factor-binding protein-related protein 1 isoform X2 n=1 Tax=Athalia rosae TaxID=37344 RepID=UPI0020338CD7|nr:insulin-like growth factor-binding protein-related protein 1 isoform X2 [Athalia rosae]